MKLKLIGCCLVVGVLSVCAAHGQQKKDNNDTALRNAITAKHYSFVAQSAIPMGRRTLQLTGRYDLTVNGDSLIAQLPYFGRADVAPMTSEEAGTIFTSTNYTYTVEQKKKGGWNITFAPKDATNYRQLYLDVSPDGYASLLVTHNFRQPMRFNGYVEARK